MALNLTNMVRAPIYNFEVFMERKRSLNAAQNARRRIEYVQAHNADDAKQIAARKQPEFIAVSAKKTT